MMRSADRVQPGTASQPNTVRTLDSAPNELLLFIADEVILRHLTEEAFADMRAFVLTCKRFYIVGSTVLYKAAALRHPYLLAWAAETGNVAIVNRMLQAGLSPNTMFVCARVSWWDMERGPEDRARSPLPVLPQHDDPIAKSLLVLPRHDDPPCSPRELLRKYYLQTDREVRISESYEKIWKRYYGLPHNHIMALYCKWFSNEGGCEDLGFASESRTRHFARLLAAFPLHLAAANNHVEVIRVLLAAGARLDVPSNGLCAHFWEGRHQAEDIWRPHPWTHDRLQPFWNLLRASDWTPLHTALCQGSDEAFWAIRAAGARVLELERPDLKSVIGHAEQLGRWDVAERLRADPAAAEVDRTEEATVRKMEMWGPEDTTVGEQETREPE